MDIENLYNTIKVIIPFAKQYLPQGTIADNVQEMQKIIDIIENLGGLKALNILNTQNVPNTSNDEIKQTELSHYEKICDID